MVDFDKAFDRLLGHEGGYTEGKGDPGGANQSSGGHPRRILAAAVETGMPA